MISHEGKARLWFQRNLPVLLCAVLLLVVVPMRDLWAPDEPDFAQCVKEMRLRGEWLVPYLNGTPYSEKPILYYWVLKLFAIGFDRLTGGFGFSHGVAAWALRLPSALASILFLRGLQGWTERFLSRQVARNVVLILGTTPIWFWQSQFIQIDLLFSALLAWSWLCGLGGFLLITGEAAGQPEEGRHMLIQAYIWLALAFLAKGPLALLLSGLIFLAFLAWQGDWTVLRRLELTRGLLILLLLAAPWYVASAISEGGRYAYELIVHQNFERATRAWDHIQPWWRYGQYLLGDFFPWVLLLPGLTLQLVRSGSFRRPVHRFLILAFLVPLLTLSAVQSKQGKYLLMGYPFLAVLLADQLSVSHSAQRLAGWLLPAGFATLGLTLMAVQFGVGGPELQVTVGPYLAILGALSAVCFGGAAAMVLKVRQKPHPQIVPAASMVLALLFGVAGTWGFHQVDPRKNYRAWTESVQPLSAGRKVFFWQTIRSGVMIYTDHLMPEIRDAASLERLDPESRVVCQRNVWEQNAWGMTPALRSRFEVLLAVPIGGSEFLLLRRKG